MILFKVILLQLFWLMIILYGKSISSIGQIGVAISLVWLDFIICRPKISFGRYLFLIIFFIFFGFLNDSSLIWMKIITKESYQYGNLSLWIVFLIYFEQIFVKFKKLPLLFLSVLGGIGGALTYWSAYRLGAIMIIPGKVIHFVLSQFSFWAVFFPSGLKLYFSDGYWDTFLDKTIFFSFDQTGFFRHKKKFTEDLSTKNLHGKNVLVTGATAGIGAEVGAFLSRIDAKVFFTGRNLEKGLAFEQKNKNSKFISLDMVNWREVYEFAKKSEPLDYVVLNAGSMPEHLVVNDLGIEFQCASQLLGHYYLLVWLKEFQKIKSGTRIVWVSSGGMYLKKLDLTSLFKNHHYEKVDTYANVKRAQVTLVEELAKKAEWNNFFIYSMHPGWVGTDGLKEALPKFYHFMKKRLRTPEEGADTILWCLLKDYAPESGGFYFDRKKVSPYVSQKYFPTASERDELMSEMEEIMPGMPAD
jgi:dehydrogenase/reductase SDR family protein 12